jgi:hypothetical protein
LWLLGALDPEVFPENTLLAMRRLSSPAMRSKYSEVRDAINEAMPYMSLKSLAEPDALKPTTSLLFRVLCEHAAARKNDKGAALDELVPDVLSFCDVLRVPIETVCKVADLEDGVELDEAQEEQFACHVSVYVSMHLCIYVSMYLCICVSMHPYF